MNATDAPALDSQLRQLVQVLDRLALVRNELMPAASTFWGGEARVAYDRAVAEIDSGLVSTIDVLARASRSTMLALAEMAHG